ncbi:MAG TPA: dihydrofolate reductase family protein [Herpetosiphonaceae bacterium]
MLTVRGPGAPFTTMFDEQEPTDRLLPREFAQIYGSWPLPPPTDRPFVYVNFVMSHDGRVSFNEPGHLGGGDVSRRDDHDRWLMGLLRARADAVLVGGSSIEAAGNHVWTPSAVFPGDAEAFAALRQREGRSDVPLLVVLTRSGNVPAHAPSLDNPGLPVLIATTSTGASRAREILGNRAWVRYLDMGEQLAQIAVMRRLRGAGIRSLLCEAGPQVYAALLQDGLIDDAFVTLSPIMIGETAEQPRPSLIEGVAFPYRQPPHLRLLSVHRHGSYLYLHSRYEQDDM